MITINLFHCGEKEFISLKKFTETSLSEKEDFYSHVNMEDITAAD